MAQVLRKEATTPKRCQRKEAVTPAAAPPEGGSDPKATKPTVDLRDDSTYIMTSSNRYRQRHHDCPAQESLQCADLRRSLRSSHQLRIEPVKTVCRRQIAINTHELRSVEKRLITHSRGHVRLLSWWERQEKQNHTPSVAVAFWFSAVEGGAESPVAHAYVSDVCITALMSAVLCFERVEFLFYQENVRQFVEQRVPGVVCYDASSCMSCDEFVERWQGGICIRKLADIVRLKRIKHRGGGWMVDVDSHWMNAIPSLQVCPPRFGHFFGSMPATNQRKPRLDLAIHREVEFLAAPQDAAWIATPWAFPPGSPILDAFLAKWDCNIARSRANKVGLQYVDHMQSMREIIEECGCNFAYVRPNVCSPLSHVLAKNTILHKPNAGLLPEGFERGVCVNAFWSSSLKAKTNAHASEIFQLGSTGKIHKDSAWSRILAVCSISAGGTRKKRKTSQFKWMLQPRANLEEAQLPTNRVRQSQENRGAAPNEVGEVPTNRVEQSQENGGAVPNEVGSNDLAVVADGDRTSRLNLAMWPTFPDMHQGPANARFLHPKSFQEKYDWLGLIGSGRNGSVFAARAMSSDVVVAIKTSRKCSAAAEPWLLQHCKHPNIVKVADFFASPFLTLIAMEKWECTAFQYRRTFDLTSSQYWKIVYGVTNGLRHMHDLSVFHLDLHAMNILLRHVHVEGDGGGGPTLVTTKEDGGGGPTNADGGGASSHDGGDDPIAISMEACIGDLGNAFYKRVGEAPDPHLIHPINYRAPEVLFAAGSKLQILYEQSGRRRIRYKHPGTLPDRVSLGALDMWAFGCFAHFFWGAEDVCTTDRNWFSTTCDVDDEAKCGSSMLISLGKPPSALVNQCDWKIVQQLTNLRATDENQIYIWNETPNGATKFCRACLSWDARRRSTAASAHEQCKAIMATEHASA